MSPARRVRVLPDAVANRIAAGEVVERPASVAKELVENSLDAGARHIRVEVEGGGKRRIRVADDGTGMRRNDAIMSLERHATSKITRARELGAITSFGFRGEALPSIAAVSHFVLETSHGQGVGTRIRVRGGHITSVEDSARARGTTVEAANLFFNAPARRRFLKAARSEVRVLATGLTGLALAHPSVAITLTADGRFLLDLPPDPGPARRVGRLWGADARASMFAFEREGEAARVRGLLQRPDRARPGARRAYLFVGGRPFHDRGLRAAVQRAYRTTVRESVRPWFLLYLDLPAGHVDVNVHPSKLEVRFRDRPGVERFVEEAVRRALAHRESAATLDAPPSPKQVREKRSFEVPVPPSATSAAPSEGGQIALFESDVPPTAEPRGNAGGAEVLVQPAHLWQLHRTYVLVEVRGGVLMIDQHSAHERILFHELMEAFAKGGQTGQGLLFPITLELPRAEYEQIEPLFGILSRAGFEVEGFGANSIIVHAVPNPHPWFEAKRCLREMIAELTQGSELVRSAHNQHERIAMTFACKGAIKAGQQLSREEMQELVDRLFATELPHHDVHGRPTAIRLSLSELERRFGRS